MSILPLLLKPHLFILNIEHKIIIINIIYHQILNILQNLQVSDSKTVQDDVTESPVHKN